jgi:hypothetical protein
MAKRSRRTRRQEKAAPPPQVSVAQTPASATQKTVDFVSEYAYIYKELTTVLIIAVVMFAVLFGLSYILY